MTSEAINDPPSNFTLQSHHLVQLRHIANTDEFQQEEEAFPSSSNSTSSPPAGPSGAYDWPQLKDAIKIQIRAVLEENFGESIAMDIHPAAKLFTQSGDSTTEQNLTTEAAATTTQDKLFATSGGETATVASSEPSATVGSSHSNGQTPFVSDADQQNFYPTKRPLSVHTFPALTPADRISYTRTLYSMLDDFDLQPPFTIQRLCELLVSPTNHYNSALKWINAVKRCLSVTATRDAFPISPVQAPIGVMGVNGAHDSEDRASGEMSESEMDRMDGLPPSATSAGGAGRSRSSSVASNNSVEPLFSPIPFIVRDENGALTHAGIGDDGQQDGAEQAGIMEPIPDLELGGADRTASANTLPKEIVDKAPTTANATTTASEFQSCQEEQRKEEKEEEAEDVEMAEEGDDDEKMREAEPESKSESTPTGSASDSSGRQPQSTRPRPIPQMRLLQRISNHWEFLMAQ
uniref:Uncharacterized protein n=1 Tax=Melanopsichium pennsylvanicum 4 TaxID=1398559 RepID=A0A077R371_9BASI|nr:conserved hypothetical protein [Melanopsichium pennsylvanicum 4]